jgi:hypothetical protein
MSYHRVDSTVLATVSCWNTLFLPFLGRCLSVIYSVSAWVFRTESKIFLDSCMVAISKCLSDIQTAQVMHLDTDSVPSSHDVCPLAYCGLPLGTPLGLDIISCSMSCLTLSRLQEYIGIISGLQANHPECAVVCSLAHKTSQNRLGVPSYVHCNVNLFHPKLATLMLLLLFVLSIVQSIFPLSCR